jgi:hypothetical protein
VFALTLEDEATALIHETPKENYYPGEPQTARLGLFDEHFVTPIVSSAYPDGKITIRGKNTFRLKNAEIL